MSFLRVGPLANSLHDYACNEGCLGQHILRLINLSRYRKFCYWNSCEQQFWGATKKRRNSSATINCVQVSVEAENFSTCWKLKKKLHRFSCYQRLEHVKRWSSIWHLTSGLSFHFSFTIQKDVSLFTVQSKTSSSSSVILFKENYKSKKSRSDFLYETIKFFFFRCLRFCYRSYLLSHSLSLFLWRWEEENIIQTINNFFPMKEKKYEKFESFSFIFRVSVHSGQLATW